MSQTTLFLNKTTYDYMCSFNRETTEQRALRELTSQAHSAGIESSSEQISFLQMLLRLMRARRCIEVGVFTGCGSLGFALAIPSDGSIVACEKDETVVQFAKKYWREAGIDKKIDLRMGPAMRTLDHLIAEGASGTFDFAYIDADKENGEPYYERILQLIRINGLIAIDNVFWGGQVTDSESIDVEATCVANLNAKLMSDDRVDINIVPLGDGLMLLRKRDPLETLRQ